MAKAYDRVSWLYLCKVMGKMGFSLYFINLIWRLLANNWYSVLLNSQAHGFFHSTRGVKQGDPLSPALLIIAAEDDTIIFSSADNQSLQMIMNTLQEYEKVSGQLINKSKSSFYMFSKVSHEVSQQVAIVTGFVRGQFPFTYLGVPITHARKRKVDYTELLKKVKDRLRTWKGTTQGSLSGSFGIIKRKVDADTGQLGLTCVFPNMKVGWDSDLFMTHPKLYVLNYGGILEPLVHYGPISCGISTAKNKFLSWFNGREGHKSGRMMLEARESIEQEIWWEPKSGSSNIWFDNWTKLGTLSYVVPQSWHINEHAEDVSELMTYGRWNVNKLMQMFPKDIVQHILQEIDIKCASNEWDRPWWMITSTGKFTIKIINHLFLCGDLAAKVWRYFNMGAGLSLNCVQVKHAIRSWWEAKCHFKIKTIYKAMPAFIVWQIWKWRNNRLHGGIMNLNRVLYDINMNIHMLCKVQFPGMNIPTIWHQIVQFFEEYKPTVIYKIITWRRPAYGVYKCNTDGAAKGNPGPSSAAFCIRKEEGDLVYAASKMLTDGTNIVAEAEAIRMGLSHCVEKQLFPLIIETDCMTMKMILNAE
ncbi:uncharacterized protein LOC132637581 [Lycium barbarum]|uniref:uncharacterized protein LOC132637581 n=1 Tax=Lycium barbarum TaxID=112863 RepID=UPI00293F0036|nr:uncharacterized protein LOC132637581 [Lycium barbarum]